MCVSSTAKRRRRQHRNGFKHLCAQRRPKYKVRDADTSARRMRRMLETERRIRAGGGK